MEHQPRSRPHCPPLALRACDRCGAWDDPSHTAEECDAILANRNAPSYDDLRAQLAAVTAERDALRAAVRLHRVAMFEELNEAVTRAELFALVLGDCPHCGGEFCGGTASTCCRLSAAQRALDDLVVPPTEEERARKTALVERKIRGEASPDELAELGDMKRRTSAWLRRVAPLPLEAMRAQADAAPAHNPGARVVATGGGR